MKKSILLFWLFSLFFGYTALADVYNNTNGVWFEQDAGSTTWSPPAGCEHQVTVGVTMTDRGGLLHKTRYRIQATMSFSRHCTNEGCTCAPVGWWTADDVTSFQIL